MECQTAENRSIRRKTCTGAILSTENPTMTALDQPVRLTPELLRIQVRQAMQQAASLGVVSNWLN